MKSEITYFKEEQYFSNFWFWVFLIVVFTSFIVPTSVALYSGLVLKNPSGENPESVVSLMVILTVFAVLYTLVILFFKRMKLDVRITSKALLFRYPPFILKYKEVLKEDISSYEVRKYNPIGNITAGASAIVGLNQAEPIM